MCNKILKQIITAKTKKVLFFKVYDSQNPLTVNIFRKLAKYDEVWLVNHPTDDPSQTIFIVDEDALFGDAISHHPDTQEEHEEEHVHHLEDRKAPITSKKHSEIDTFRNTAANRDISCMLRE